MAEAKKNSSATTINNDEINHFAKDSGKWWDENGPFKPLHRLNPVRMGYIKDKVTTHFKIKENTLKPFDNLSFLDIGCGGGLVCEPLARLGGNVTGLDADQNAINCALAHTEEQGLTISYLCDDLAHIREKFDVVTALEIIEHVDNPALFFKQTLNCLKPNGILIMSTLNKTPKSYALGIIAAEYILGWVPKGTHNWRKFLKPSELCAFARQNNAEPIDITGLIFNPVQNKFSLSERDLDVNYLICVKKNI